MQELVLAYPDYSQEFEICTDALSKQLGTVITQGNKPITFSSGKLTKMQQHYSVTKIELLAIVETLKEFKRHTVGTKDKRSSPTMNPHPRCPWVNLRPCLSVEATS